MSTNAKKKDKKSTIMNTVKKGLKSMRNSSTKTIKLKAAKSKTNKHIVTPLPSSKHTIYHSSINSDDSDSQPSHGRKTSFIPSFINNKENTTVNHRKNDSIIHNVTSTFHSTQKLKSSKTTKHTLPFNIPSLFINKKPAHLTHTTNDTNTDEFNHLLYDRNGTHLNTVIIAINIDIEQVYNAEYDNNYNRKLLGPLQPVRIPLIIDTNHEYIQTETEISDYSSDEQENEWQTTEKKKLTRKHKKSASSSVPDSFMSRLNANQNRPRRRTAMAQGYAPVNTYEKVAKKPVNLANIAIDGRPHKRERKRIISREEKSQKTDIRSPDLVNLKFENKYDCITKITPDELEVLARKLLSTHEFEENSNNYIGFGGKHGMRKNASYIHPKHRLKRNHHRHLLKSNVERKSESVSFGLQLINSIKQITAFQQNLMETFSDGLNDLLRICQQFIELIIEPLPRQVYNDYNDKIVQYTNLVRIIDAMSSNFYDSSQNLKDNIPALQNVMQSNVSNRINQYQSYAKDMKAADNDIKSLETHCDRTLRRLFREIPRPIVSDAPELNRKKSLKQHKGIRVFGEHYIASNSNEHICRSVPSKIRSGSLANYIHYLTLIDAMNINVKKSYEEILPKLNVEFEESQSELKTQISDSLRSLDKNLQKHSNARNGNEMHRFNKNKPNIDWDKSLMRAKGVRKSKPLQPIKPYIYHKNVLMASPMHTNDVITKIREYVNEEYEKKTYDEFEMIKVQKKNFKDQKQKENGKFNLLKNYGIKFDSANFINDEVILNFFNNHYYHLGDILFEIPELYEAFEDYLKTKLSAENLYFLRQIDDIYFNCENVTFNHSIAVQQTRNISKTFIDEESRQQINLPGNVRKKIMTDLKKIHRFKDPLSIFDKAYDNISHLIHKESLPNFYKSQHFKNWYDKQREKNEKILKKERKMRKS